jgi:hypothetical protein
LPWSTSVKPAGNTLVVLNMTVGEPVAVSATEPSTPTVNAALLELVIFGVISLLTVRTNDCVDRPPEFVAVSVNLKVPALAGVPEIVAVPFDPATKCTPEGSVPCSVSAAAGSPLVETVNVFFRPVQNVAAGL